MKHELPFRLALLVAGSTLALHTAAQSFTLRGRVLDDAHEPVIGASVLVKGSARTTSTDETGLYVLTGLRAGWLTLQVAFMGHTPQERTPGTGHGHYARHRAAERGH